MTKKKVRPNPAPEYVGAPFLEPSEAKGVPCPAIPDPELTTYAEKFFELEDVERTSELERAVECMGKLADGYPLYSGVPGEELPELDEYKIRDMFPVDPMCKEKHVFPMMKLDVHFREMGEQLFYSCPHNEHLQRALLSLRQAQLGCHKAIMSEENI